MKTVIKFKKESLEKIKKYIENNFIGVVWKNEDTVIPNTYKDFKSLYAVMLQKDIKAEIWL